MTKTFVIEKQKAVNALPLSHQPDIQVEEQVNNPSDSYFHLQN